MTQRVQDNNAVGLAGLKILGLVIVVPVQVWPRAPSTLNHWSNRDAVQSCCNLVGQHSQLVGQDLPILSDNYIGPWVHSEFQFRRDHGRIFEKPENLKVCKYLKLGKSQKGGTTKMKGRLFRSER